ncbi:MULTISPECIES: hypothetical protein [Rhizobium]|uniref:Uncharacterized protein n=1 Tax=Rhizobium favelukesii TaxID=348824 RepID=W6RIQ5_9HYPH|nr:MULTISPECIES: hypothetical protein [Rhizobium]MCA0802784.1 hypothetical protein [Rhizobium sp. T1473]MCS0463270.1 hypothetical protein [Rhizobium favelukesii]UFS83646.1 hypothetical protein LPB79_15705 [Rhizobium sp. T136]CDM58738.1 hypothetical protein LPU83_3088 [Rhizobium favelukesii]
MRAVRQPNGLYNLSKLSVWWLRQEGQGVEADAVPPAADDDVRLVKTLAKGPVE